MKRTALFFIIVFSIITLFSTVCLAEENMMNDAMQSAENTMEDTKNVIQDTTDNMASGVKKGVNSISNTMNNIGTSVKDTMNMDNNRYTAERTSTTGYVEDGSFLGLNSTAWTWIIIGIIGAIVIGLIIYYNTQGNYDSTRSRNRDNY